MNSLVGKTIRKGNWTVTIAHVYSAERYDGFWDIEFIDTYNNHRHWKQQLDGGELE